MLQAIWSVDDEGSMTSVQSLEEMEKFRRGLHMRDPSLDRQASFFFLISSLRFLRKFRFWCFSKGFHEILKMSNFNFLPSFCSRLSGGSTQSEVLPSSDKKKKLGLFGKLKKLTKSRSIDHDSEMGSTGHVSEISYKISIPFILIMKAIY